jgi:sacsin
MKNVIPVAYSKLLNSLKTLFEDGSLQSYNFFSLWPLNSELIQRNPWEEFVKMLYTSLVQAKLFYSESTSQWLSMSESKFLDPDILGQPGSLPCVLDVIHHLNLPLVELPSSYKSLLNLAHQSLTEKEFVGLFYANLTKLSSIKIRDSRNDVIMYMLEAYATQYDDESELVCLLEKKFTGHAFIPTAPDGSVLRKCTDIVSPEATFAGLFDESDHRFPLKTLANRHLVMTALGQAGMMESTLNWDLIINRAQSVEALMEQDQVKALKRVRLIVQTFSGSVDGKPPTSGTTIDSVKFLPVMRKPERYPLSWYGDGCKLLSGRQLILSEVYTYSGRDTMERIAGSQAAFLCENLPKDGGCDYINNYGTRKLLQLRDSPSLCEVITQLKNIVDQFNSSSPPQLDWLNTSCEEIYKFIERAVSNGESNLDELKEIACIWNGRKFLGINSIALNWKLSDGPYLYAAPPSIASKEKLSKLLRIKKNFTGEDAQKALEKIKSYSGSKPIDKSCEQLVIELLAIFHHLSSEAPKELEVLKGKVFLPDTKNVLHKSCELVFNDVAWAPIEETSLQVSEKLPRDLAISLGVRLVRSKILEQYVSKKLPFRGVSFGQREELTRRIQNIIRDYPFDETVLKELLQNADDAKATKMYIILDRRTHGKNSVISEEWQKLQGPALLVWNDSVFTEKDLEGIQQLGLGSKRSEAETIGQYGIGFNVVYHLTDCPSFITNGDTLCVLDPHCRYVPEAKETLPGARYDNLKNGFWRDFADVSSAYLQDSLDGVPKELQGGSLFRLPIRHTYDMVKSSKIVDPLNRESQRPLKADDLSRLMQNLMPMMKQAMFFLNHVTEIKYMEIDCMQNSIKVETKFRFKAEITEPLPDYKKSLNTY